VPRQYRFNRDFALEVQPVNGPAIEVVPPMRVAFDASKAVSGGLNKMIIRVYNLNEQHRLGLAKDAEDQTKRIPIQFSVGYVDMLRLLFKGTVHRGENYREGPDFVTELECLDGGYDFLNSFTSRTVKGKRKAIEAILGDMPNTTPGKLTEQTPLLRPKVLVGAPGKLFDSLVDEGETWFIEDEKLYVVKDKEVLSNFVPLVRADTGLLNTPTREQAKVTFDTLLNPTLRIGHLCDVESQSAPHLNGIYKIDAISYEGDNYGDKWAQSVVALPAQGYKVL